jgi:hypothetical protein
MMFSEFIYACFGSDMSYYACGGLLNLLIHFMIILAHGYLLVILLWSICEDSFLFLQILA